MDVVAPNSTVVFSFNTVRFSTGAPHTLAGTPSMYARVDGNATELTTGITLTADFDSKTGENKVSIDLSASASYTAGSKVEVFVAQGTVDSVSVVGLNVYEFRIGTSGSLDSLITRGLLALPAVAHSASGGLPTVGTGTGQVNVSGGRVDCDLQRWRGTQPAALTDTDKVQVSVQHKSSSLALSAQEKLDVNNEADTALADYDAPTNSEMVARTLAAAAYATAAAQTTAQNDLDLLTGADGVTLATSQPNYAPSTVAALAALAAKFTGITLVAQWLGAMAGKHTPNATAITEINATGAGGGTFAGGDGLEGIKDALPAGGGDATAANQTTIINHLVGMKGTSWDSGDSLKAIQDGVAALSAGSGAGAFSVSLTVYQSGGVTLVPECDVILTTTSSSPSTNIYGSGRSNANGVVTFQCDAGTYYIWRQKAGINFSDNPRTLTVAADGSSTVT